MSQTITPFLWFNDNAEEAVNFYISVFKDGRVTDVTRYGDTGPGPKGQVMTMAFELNGQQFTALNGGPHFKFTEAISFVVKCETQEEIDYYWDKLLDGGEASHCGWLKDKFGLSWQVVPAEIRKFFGSDDPVRTARVIEAMMPMAKFDIAKLQEAYEG